LITANESEINAGRATECWGIKLTMVVYGE
jgi:hypothetical protein